ncbi:hypothetical protein [Microbacterium sp. SSM24]|uniref:hypothetical protein n=1 Tax=Microbacterium sp. SSM24 TaxID=2991714 RepID=UPI00222788D8|nr:hypothetical protein [Microbacterium sp. SSM24]MCW3493151.1 hypothetical protein [Microbacterium sp. SSM24]
MTASRRGRALRAAVISAALFGLAACAPAGSPAPSASAGLPAGVTVELQQLRSDVAARQAQVVVTNDTDEELVVGDVAIDDPRFDGAIARVAARDSTIAPGRSVGIRVQLPPVACDDIPEAVTATVDLTYTLGDSGGEASVPIDDPLDFVAPLHERECRVVLLSAAADVAFTAFEPSPAGEPAVLELTVTPTGAGGAGIRSIQTTNLLTFAAPAGDTADAHAIDVELEPGATEPVVLPLPLVPLRCDPHAVQEDKRGTIFDLQVEIDGEPGEIELAASEDMRGEILTWVANWCGFGS